jgi:hypothetical protein
VFVSDGTTVQRIAGVGDVLMTDIGPREVGFLMGGVDINSSGAVSFGVQFSSGSGGGNAVFVATCAWCRSAQFRGRAWPAGPFDIALPLTGTPGVECRQARRDLRFTSVVVTFAAPVTLSSAMVTSGSGAVESRR